MQLFLQNKLPSVRKLKTVRNRKRIAPTPRIWYFYPPDSGLTSAKVHNGANDMVSIDQWLAIITYVNGNLVHTML